MPRKKLPARQQEPSFQWKSHANPRTYKPTRAQEEIQRVNKFMENIQPQKWPESPLPLPTPTCTDRGHWGMGDSRSWGGSGSSHLSWPIEKAEREGSPANDREQATFREVHGVWDRGPGGRRLRTPGPCWGGQGLPSDGLKHRKFVTASAVVQLTNCPRNCNESAILFYFQGFE